MWLSPSRGGVPALGVKVEEIMSNTDSENAARKDSGTSKSKKGTAGSGSSEKETGQSPLLFAAVWFGIPFLFIILYAAFSR